MSSCGSCCFTLHARDGIPKSSCRGPSWKHPCLRAAWGWNSLVVWRGVLEVCHLVPVVISDTLLHASCASELEKQLCCLDRCSWEIQQESLLCCFFSSLALLRVGAHPVLVQSSYHKAKSWIGWGLGTGSHSEVSMHRGCSRGYVWLLWQTAPFLPLHCLIGKKMGGDNYCSSPSLLTRAWQGDGTCHSQACHLLTQQLGGRGVGSCSILLHSLAIRKVSCFWFCV